MKEENSGMQIGSIGLLAVAALLIPLAGLMLLQGDDLGLMWLMGVGFFLGLLLLVGGAFLADKAARE